MELERSERQLDVEAVADELSSRDHVKVAGQADADGVTSSALLCMALESNDVSYTFTAVDEPDRCLSVDADVFCDVGASYLDRLDGSVVLDHHEGTGEGSTGVSAVDSTAGSTSEIAYEVAQELDVDRPDVAAVGAAGDSSIPDWLAEAAVDQSLARISSELKLYLDEPAEALAHSIEPYTRLSGEYAAAREFVDSVDGEPASDDDRLATAVTLLAAEEGRVDAVEELTGALELRRYGGRSASTVAATVEACARTGKTGLAFAVLYSGEFDRAERVRRAYESGVASAVENSEMEHRGGFVLVRTSCQHTSAVADVYSRWIDDGVDDVVVVDEEGGSASIRSEDVDCASVAEEAAEAVDGEGGGHRDRAGASFAADGTDEFVESLEERWT